MEDLQRAPWLAEELGHWWTDRWHHTVFRNICLQTIQCAQNRLYRCSTALVVLQDWEIRSYGPNKWCAPFSLEESPLSIDDMAKCPLPTPELPAPSEMGWILVDSERQLVLMTLSPIQRVASRWSHVHVVNSTRLVAANARSQDCDAPQCVHASIRRMKRRLAWIGIREDWLRCVIDVKAWLASRCLLLNENKTEAILFVAPNNRITQPPPLCIDVCGCSIIASTNIRDLGVQLDSTMSMAAHMSRTCRTAYAQLRCINRIRSSLPVSARKTLVHALVTSKLDFGNAALYGITWTLLHGLEMVQRAADRVVMGLRRRDQHSMTAALQQLHWLHVAYRIQFKLLTLVHGAIHANTPRYLADRVSAYVPSRSLRSADQSLLVLPRVNLERFGRRAFSCAGPSLWNSLPLVLRTEQDGERFRRDLKTYIVKQCVYHYLYLDFYCFYSYIILYV